MRKATVVKAAKIIGTWIPAVLLVLIFVPQGWSKFSDASGWAVAFRHWGYPDWFRVTIGVMELSAVAPLMLGRTAAVGAILLIIVMLGGMATHIIFDGGRNVTSERGGSAGARLDRAGHAAEAGSRRGRAGSGEALTGPALPP